MEHVFRDRTYALKFLFMRQLRWILNFDIDTRYFSSFSFIFMKEEEESIILFLTHKFLILLILSTIYFYSFLSFGVDNNKLRFEFVSINDRHIEIHLFIHQNMQYNKTNNFYNLSKNKKRKKKYNLKTCRKTLDEDGERTG